MNTARNTNTARAEETAPAIGADELEAFVALGTELLERVRRSSSPPPSQVRPKSGTYAAVPRPESEPTPGTIPLNVLAKSLRRAERRTRSSAERWEARAKIARKRANEARERARQLADRVAAVTP